MALVRGQEAIDAGSARPLTFASARSAQIAAGSLLTSDPVELTVPRHGDLALDVYLPGRGDHLVALETRLGFLQHGAFLVWRIPAEACFDELQILQDQVEAGSR